MPRDADVPTFLLSDGKLNGKPTVASSITLASLFDKYRESLPDRSIEESTLYTARIHMNHVARVIGRTADARGISLVDLQRYVDKRSKEKGHGGRAVSATTIRKEVVTFASVWRWAKRVGHLDRDFPNTGLTYPKEQEKPAFQTWEEIERKIARGGLTETEQTELWDCLFLTLPEIEELLGFVKQSGRWPFVYPMFVFAAHTGARRSEMVRSEIDDFDFEGGTVLIREKKRVRGKLSTRRVPLSPLLVETMRHWFANHPGGRHTFCLDCRLPRGRKTREIGTPITRDEAHDHFKRTLAGSKWDKLRGWHVFRHSFCSNCAAKGIDQRIINAWVGHQTEEMVRRYRHLIPNQQQEAIRAVFGPTPIQ
ncbi:MAG: site-specific integrase [Candidatus Anammoximicrobium sp.]|nr:site-specific integrase [Candidatus Anammoximicrobium sp.]